VIQAMSKDEVINFILNNGITTGILVICLSTFVYFIKNQLQKCIQTRRIISFLNTSAKEEKYKFRSTEVIASATNLTETKVEELCSASGKIVRNSAQKQSWALVE
jgi:uncharacterized membrane protein